LRWLAAVFFLYYLAFFIRHGPRLRSRQRDATFFLPFLNVVLVADTAFWLTLQVAELVPLVITFVWPDPTVVAWCCAVMTFLGYQIILAFMYRDVFGSSAGPE
jgi:hypothetical protein